MKFSCRKDMVLPFNFGVDKLGFKVILIQ